MRKSLHKLYLIAASLSVAFAASATGLNSAALQADALAAKHVKTAEASVLSLPATAAASDLKAPAKAGEATTWVDLGECTYTEPFFTHLYGLSNMTYKVHIEENADVAGHYRLVAPYGTAFADAFVAAGNGSLAKSQYDSTNSLYLEIHAEDPAKVYVLLQASGVTLDADGEISVLTYGGYFLMNGQTPAASQCGSLKDGVITFPMKNTLVTFEKDPSIYYGNSKSAVDAVVLPNVVAKDYSATVDLTSAVDADKQTVVTASFTFGEDVASASVLFDIANYCVEEEIDMATKTATFTAPLGGEMTAVVTLYDANGDAKNLEYGYLTVKLAAADPNWKLLGNAKVADGWITPFFLEETDDLNDYVVDVPVYESTKVAGVYALEGLYSKTIVSVINQNLKSGSDRIYVNASDKDLVVIPFQYSGFTMDANQLGAVSIMNIEGWYNYNGVRGENLAYYATTTFKDGVITVPQSYLTGTGALFGGQVYYMDTTTITLPGASSGVADLEAADEAPAVYYNLQGVEVKTPAAGNVYIVKKGSAVSKQLVR